MYKISAAMKALALVCAVGLLAVAPLALAGSSGYLGVVLQEISPSMAKALQLGDTGGVLVSEVVDGSPAAEAGLMAGDVIINFAGADLGQTGALTKAVQATQPGDEADLIVLRDGQQRSLTVVVGERENDFSWTFAEGDHDHDHDVQIHGEHDFEFHGEEGNVWVQSYGEGDDQKVIIKRMHEGDDHDIRIVMAGMDDDRGFLGVTLDDIEGQMAEFYEVEDGKGALVTGIIEESGAESAGLKAGDVIVKIGDEDISSASDVHEALAGTEAEQELKIQVVRKGKNKSMDVKLGEMPENAMSRHMEIIGPDNEFTIKVPKMMHRMHVAPRVEMRHEFEMEKEELEEMREELEVMREELEEMREELKKK